MEAEAETNEAFADLEADLAKGKKVPIKPRGKIDWDSWTLFSSQFFLTQQLGSIDTSDWGYDFGERITLHLNSRGARLGWESDVPDVLLSIPGMPRVASLDPTTWKTRPLGDEVKVWFAGRGYLRLQMNMRPPEGGKAVPVIWSGIHSCVNRKKRTPKEVKNGLRLNLSRGKDSYPPNEDLREPYLQRPLYKDPKELEFEYCSDDFAHGECIYDADGYLKKGFADSDGYLYDSDEFHDNAEREENGGSEDESEDESDY
ncbi:hypothetical protein P171DRAFT_233766 [Karstenula rhodostoma CBS 690.94]|uniref:Uncharacterized protein n=1 Tax=Karstenula rhodostoma CBS 690.94 TaxID=1392251 RepID=A0A9P4PPP8_9PLEO|nr:hypothetical protein P171DRAFT_233766 [Karstenula rhodostoma CBS 690.94]